MSNFQFAVSIMLSLLISLLPCTRLFTNGHNKSNLDRNECFIKCSAGDTPVVLLGVFLYMRRNRDSFTSKITSACFQPTCTNLSFPIRWWVVWWSSDMLYAICFHTHFKFRSSELWSIVRYKLLQYTIPGKHTTQNFKCLLCSRGWQWNDFQPLGMGIHNNHKHGFLRWACKKSTCILIHRPSGQAHGCNNADGGVFLILWQDSPFVQYICLGLGHQTWTRAGLFILTIPGWLACNSFVTSLQHASGITTLIPHSKHPASVVSSFRLEIWPKISVYHIWPSILDIKEDLIQYQDAHFNRSASTGRKSIWLRLNAVVIRSTDSWACKGSRKNPSALQCFSIERNSMSYW